MTVCVCVCDKTGIHLRRPLQMRRKQNICAEYRHISIKLLRGRQLSHQLVISSCFFLIFMYSRLVHVETWMVASLLSTVHARAQSVFETELNEKKKEERERGERERETERETERQRDREREKKNQYSMMLSIYACQ